MTFEIYIHVPFCLRRCGYCDFNTYTAVDMGAGASRGNYANMVIREMAIVRDWQTTHGINEPKVATVFLGGGTPTTLKASDLVAMLDAVRATWGIADDAEITTEANPDTVNADYVKELADGGFNARPYAYAGKRRRRNRSGQCSRHAFQRRSDLRRAGGEP